jgi:flagellin-like hook-associated protein FlgL
MPSGATDATITGGTATVTFDQTTGAFRTLNASSGFSLTPSPVAPGSTAAPSVKINLRADGLAQASGAPTAAGTSRLYTVFDKLVELRDRLRAGFAPAAEDFETLALLQASASEEEARAGSLGQLLENADRYLGQQREHLQAMRSRIQDIDTAEIGMKLSYEEVMLEAALSAGARIIPRSLLDFLT